MGLAAFLVTDLRGLATIWAEFDLAAKYSWLGSVAIIIGFFWIQTKLDQLSQDWTHTVLFLLSLIAEVYVLWLLNSQAI